MAATRLMNLRPLGGPGAERNALALGRRGEWEADACSPVVSRSEGLIRGYGLWLKYRGLPPLFRSNSNDDRGASVPV